MNTGFLSPTTIIQNAQGVNSWSNPNNILIPNGQFAVSTGSTNILTLGNFNFNVGQDNLVSNFTVRVKGYRGSFNTTLQIIAIDDTSGVELAYPMTPFQGFSGSNTLYTLASSTFNTSWTVDQANNLKLRLIADGELYLDNIQIECSFVAINPVVPPTPTLGDLVVDEFVQGQRFQLAQSMTSSDLFCFVQSFNFPNGSPIQITDFYGNALIVVDQGKAGLEENIRITNIEHNYNGSGLVRLSFTEIENRGLDFAYPYTHDITLCRAHTGTAEVVISNSAPFYDRFLKKNQADVLFSIPIEVKANGSVVTSHVHGFNFVGPGVVITPDGVDPDKVIVTIAGAQNATPVPVSTSTATSGTTAVPSLTWQHTTSGIDRLLRVLVSTDAVTAVSSVTYNGVALTLNQTATNGVVRLREYFLVAPPVGTYDIVVTVSPNSVITAGAESYVSVNQASAIGVVDTDTGNSNNPTVTINTATNYSVIVDGIATAQTPIAYVTGSAQQVANYTVTPNTSSRQLGSSYQKAGTSPDAVVMDWTITQITDWVHLATEIKGTPVTIASPDEKVKISATDTTAGYLSDKLTAGSNIVLTVLNPGANEEIEISTSPVAGTLEVEENGVSVETGVNKINILAPNGTVTNPATGEVSINLLGLGSGGSGTKLAIDTDEVSNATTTPATAFTIPIPANTLGTNDAIRFTITGATDGGLGDGETTISYGGQSLGTVTKSGSHDFVIYGLIIADNATGAQKTQLQLIIDGSPQEVINGALTVDSTAQEDLEVSIVSTNTREITLEAIVVEKISSGGVNAPISEQNLGGFGKGVSNQGSVFSSMTSELDGSVVYLAFEDEDSADFQIARLVKDNNTGFYKKTHTAIVSSSGQGGSLAIIGTYLYVATSQANNVRRLNKADLSNETAMTESTPFTITGTGAMFTDGTDLFINLNRTIGTWTRYTISGTTLTTAGTITGGATDITTALRYANGNVYMSDRSDVLNTISAYTYTTTFTLTTSDTYGMLQLKDINTESTVGGIIPISSTIFFVGLIGLARWYDGSSSENSENLFIKPFTIPS